MEGCQFSMEGRQKVFVFFRLVHEIQQGKRSQPRRTRAEDPCVNPYNRIIHPYLEEAYAETRAYNRKVQKVRLAVKRYIEFTVFKSVAK